MFFNRDLNYAQIFPIPPTKESPDWSVCFIRYIFFSYRGVFVCVDATDVKN
jgi:hypothetical protein